MTSEKITFNGDIFKCLRYAKHLVGSREYSEDGMRPDPLPHGACICPGQRHRWQQQVVIYALSTGKDAVSIVTNLTWEVKASNPCQNFEEFYWISFLNNDLCCFMISFVFRFACSSTSIFPISHFPVSVVSQKIFKINQTVRSITHKT